jgi:hypothetical protein
MSKIKTESKPGALVTEAQPQLSLAKVQPSQELIERMNEAKEALKDFTDLKLPVIRFQNGFILEEGNEAQEEFEGVILYTKQTNVFYKSRYKAGSHTPPDCTSANGRTPDATVREKQSESCEICPKNQFGSAADGVGKACRNTRPVFILLFEEMIPRILRVPPTSLKMVKDYALNTTVQFGSYTNVLTKFGLSKKNDGQTYFNIKFSKLRGLSPEEKANTKLIKDTWINVMKDTNTGDDDLIGETEAPIIETSNERDF